MIQQWLGHTTLAQSGTYLAAAQERAGEEMKKGEEYQRQLKARKRREGHSG